MTALPQGLTLQPIDESTTDQAIDLLVRGFPRRSETSWRRSLALARSELPGDTGWPLGFLLRSEGRPVGIMLTLASRRTQPDGTRNLIVNLSSWYVAPEERAAAPWMLMRILGRGDAIYTDLTPTPRVKHMLPRLDFTQWSQGTLVISWPQTLVAPRSGAVIEALVDLPDNALDSQTRALLADHQRLGCLTAALYDGAEWHPLIFQRFQPVRRRKLSVARLIYARDRALVMEHRRAVSRFLLRHGRPVWFMDGDRAPRPAGCIFLDGLWSKYFRGPMPRSRIDYAYSEFVFEVS